MATLTAVDQEKFHRRTGVTDADYSVLSRVPMFSGLSPPALCSLLAEAWVQTFPRNAVLFLQDEPALRCYVIFRGWVKLFRTSPAGDETVIAVFTRGESFAEAALFDRGRYPVSAAVVEECRALVIPAEPFIRCLSEHGEYALKVLASISRHLRGLVRQLEQLTQRSSTERVAEFLLRLAPAHAGVAIAHLPLDKSLIASRLGMQPETFSRALAKLRRHGVTCDGSEVTIYDTAALARLSKGKMT